MSNVQPLHPKPPAPIKCNFCNQPKTETRVILQAASGATICRDCITKAKTLIKETTE